MCAHFMRAHSWTVALMRIHGLNQCSDALPQHAVLCIFGLVMAGMPLRELRLDWLNNLFLVIPEAMVNLFMLDERQMVNDSC